MALLRKNRIYIACTLICAAVVGLMLAQPVMSAEERIPTIFINDIASYSESSFPLELYSGVEHIPLGCLVEFAGVEVNIQDNGNFLIMYGKNYLTFNISKKEAFSGKTGEDFNTRSKRHVIEVPQINLTYYIPAAQVCNLLGIESEYSASPRAFRIYNSSATLSFKELLEKYQPATVPVPTTPPPKPTEPTTKPPAVTEPVTTTTDRQEPSSTQPTSEEETTPEPTTEPEDITHRNLHLIFNGVPGEAASDILDLLAQRGLRTTFYVTRADIIGKPHQIRTYIAAGHEVGIYVPSLASPETAPAYIDSVNELLIAATKYAATDILCADEKTRNYLSREAQIRPGYDFEVYSCFFRDNIEVVTAHEEITAHFLARQSTTCLLTQSQDSLAIMKSLIEFIDTKSNYTFN